MTDPVWLTPVYFITAYLVYWFAPDSVFWGKMTGRGTKSTETESRNSLFLQKFLGFILLGPGTLAAAMTWGPVSENRFGIQWPNGPHAFSLFISTSVVTLILMSLRPVKSLNTDYYPQVRLKEWKPADILFNTLLWILYLFSYEFVFRGLMFFPLLGILGFWPAAIIGTVIYSTVHIPKGAKEAVTALPFGILLYYIAMETSSMLIPFFIHLILALMNDYRSLNANPRMSVSIKWRKYESRKKL